MDSPGELMSVLVLARPSVTAHIVHFVNEPNDLTDEPFEDRMVQIAERQRRWCDDRRWQGCDLRPAENVAY